MTIDLDFARLAKALMDGQAKEAERIWAEALNSSFERGEEYAKDSVGEWNRP